MRRFRQAKTREKARNTAEGPTEKSLFEHIFKNCLFSHSKKIKKQKSTRQSECFSMFLN
jgi:hypothetical protein